MTCLVFRRTVLTLLVVLATIALSGCDAAKTGTQQPPETSVDLRTQQFDELMKRPDIDQITEIYYKMYDQLKQQLSKAFPTIKWQKFDNQGDSGCSDEFAAVDADLPEADTDSRGLEDWGVKGGVTDANWPSAESVFLDVVKKYGFNGQPQVMNDRPGAHDLRIYDQYKAQLTFTLGQDESGVFRMGFMVITGCHLTAAAKRRGHPATPPSY